MNGLLPLLGCLTIGTILASGSSAAEPMKEVMACRAEPDPSVRLACFDRATASLAAKSPPVTTRPGALPGEPTASEAAPAPPADPVKQFGLPEVAVAKQEVAAGRRAQDATKIEAHVTRLSQTTDGRAILTLDNDQVWRQLAADTDLFLKAGDAVTISRAALGSFWLQTASKRGSKVTRVR